MVKSSAAAPPAKKRGRGRPPSIKVNDDPKRGRGRPPVIKVNDEQYESSRKELLDRKKEIQSRLNKYTNVASIDTPPDITSSSTTAVPSTSSAAILSKLPPSSKVPQLPSTLKTTDTHWDYTLKEMAWLSTDFTSERKRQISQAKKLSNAILTYFATLESKKKRELQQNEIKVRKLGNKLNKLVLNSYWKKMEKVVEYKQRLNGESARRKEMDKRLVFLVKQTERYGERLTRTSTTTTNTGENGSSEEGSKKSTLTIEESLSTSLGRRSTTKKSIDYMKLDAKFNDSDEDSMLYGETTHISSHTHTRIRNSTEDGNRKGPIASKKDDNVDYIPTQSELNQEIKDENIEYTNLLNSFQQESKDDVTKEVLKLLQEKDMDIDCLLKRLMEEGGQQEEENEEMEVDDDEEKGKPLIEVVDEKPAAAVDENKVDARAAKKQRVSFAPEESTTLEQPLSDTGTAAAQPKSNNSLAMLNEDDHEEKDEFHLEREELDDETTIAAEERLGRDMSYEAEIDLLNRENEMSVEELRAMYANMDDNAVALDEEVDEEDEEDSLSPSAAVAASSLLDEDDHEEKDEFHLEREELDDETTIAAEERLGRDMSYEAEIDLLNQENEISVEELRKMYANMDNDSPEEDDDEDEEVSVPPAAAAASEDKSNVAASSLLDEDDHEEKDEFHLEREELDDETTIAAEERLGRDMSYEAEIELLNRENEMSVEELRAMYANMDGDTAATDPEDEEEIQGDEPPAKQTATSLLDEDDHEEKDEFHLEKEELDDETTIAAEERLGRDMSYEAEIELLNQENEMSVEELRAMYANMDEEGNDDEESDTVDSEDRMDTSSDDASAKRKHSSSSVASDSDDTSSKKTKTEEDEGISALQSLVASDTKARETMLTRPFLLASWVKLRAYQHVGLNWLVSIQSRRLNGILADEMGLGKTLQTISMLAYLASYKGIWGPHLIIVPTSCLVNWEVEFKRFCPGLKVLCYYGNAKRRKELRVGWTKPNVHHVVITSYQIAVQDSHAFKRKKWYYLILDEAHNIKNFESQRWQTLISFNTQRRLLLTGTPLQNNLMELWSLLHFLMPHVFTDRKQFSYWFSNPMDSIIEGNTKRNDDLINRLHGIIRPFVLRRLKKDVETQLPGKFEHIVKCQLSRRQMFLYEEFMARSSTRKAMSGGGNFMGMMSVLMQLRKVCNHPDLFEPRSVTSPFVMEPISMSTAACVVNAIEPESALEQVSPFLRLPLWTMGRGTPSFDRSTSADDVFAGQLSDIKTPESVIVEDVKDDDLTEPKPRAGMNAGLFALLTKIRSAEKDERVSRAKFIGSVNTQRCESSSFPYSNRLCQAVSIDPSLSTLPLRKELTAPQLASTPLELLEMRKSQEERAMDLDEVAEKFVFCVPKAGTKKPVLFSSKNNSTSSIVERALTVETKSALDNYYTPFKKAESRLTMCMPDKKLVQFDAGKLQKLAVLLRELKHGGHRVLIFTQMSKMLDVLEAFLNLNGHTYLRLDGATDVERRQRLMDRFNNDPKIFCFILSTRSGGLGINLTGADTVVFYDSDWNPAMDAQAQDRAHRIGQTREVHIYRMVTEHSIEENILRKAKQKSNLDFLVMDEGKFHASSAPKEEEVATDDAKTEDDSTFTKDKLQNILGIQADEVDEVEPESSKSDNPMSKDQLEAAMATLEDEDDAKAMQSAKQEAAAELQEFDETAQKDDNAPDESKDKDAKQEKKPNKKRLSVDSTDGSNPKSKKDTESDDEKEMEQEFAKWQKKVGMDASTIHESLNPLERYGLNVKEYIDPFYSKYFWAEYQRKAQTTEENNEWDIEEIEQQKVKDELKAFEDGDLLATFPEPEALPRQRELYIREKTRLKSEIVKRKLTGENWITKSDEGRSTLSYWHNVDTGEVAWEKPQVLKNLEAEEDARKKGWTALPNKLLIKVMEYLSPYPERTTCAATCSNWQIAANNASFILHVWPIEQGAMVKDKNQLTPNHFCTLSDAIEAAHPGNTIELGDGHYFINDPGLLVDKPIRLVGDENEPGHVILELRGELVWKSRGWMEGLTIRRSRIASTGPPPNRDMLRIESGGRLDMYKCNLDNRGSIGNCISVDSNASGNWESIIVTGASRDHSGILIKNGGRVELTTCTVSDNDGVGITKQDKAIVKQKWCTIERNGLTIQTQEKEQEDVMMIQSVPDVIQV